LAVVCGGIAVEMELDPLVLSVLDLGSFVQKVWTGL
jgi:hypothetical protein